MASANLDIRIEAKDAFSATFDSLHNSLGQVNTATKATGAGFGGLVDGLGKIGLAAEGVKAIFSGIVSVFGAPVKAASDLNESMGKSVVIFGDAAAGVQAFAAGAAEALGMSKQQALEASGSFGNLFVSMGVGTDAAAALSQRLVTAAGDLGALNNVSNEDALEKLRAGLIGEAEPLRSLGILLSAAAVEERALAETHKASAKELTEGDKALARYSLILEGAATSQGNFADTATDFAGAQKRMQAGFANLQAEVGGIFLPTINRLLNVFTSEAPAAFEALKSPLGAIGVVFQDVAGEILTFIRTVRNIGEAEGVDVFTATITALELRIGEVFGSTAQSIFHGFVDLLSDVRVAGGVLYDALADLVGFIATNLLARFGEATEKGRPVGLTLTDIGLAAKAGAQAVREITDMFMSATPAGEALRLVADILVVSFVTWKLALIATTLATNAYAIGLGVVTTAQAAWSVVTTVASGIGIAFAGVMSAINLVLSLNPIGLVVIGLALLAGALVLAYNNSETFRNIVNGTWEVLKGAVSATITFVVDTFNTFVTYMAGLPARITALATGIGTGIVDGIVGGINSFTAKVRGTVEDLANSLPGWVKTILGIASPSTVFAEIGMDIVDGLAQGIDESTGIAETAMMDLAAAIGATVPVVLSASEQATSKMMSSIEGAQAEHHKRVLDAETDHNVKIADLTADLAAAKPAQRKAILDRIADEETAYQRKTEGLAVDHEGRLTEIRQRGAEDQLAIAERQNATNYQAAQDLMSGLATIEASTASALDGVGERTGTRINEAIQAAASAIADVSQRATDQIASASGNLDASRELRGRRAEFGAGQTAQADERKAAQESADLIDKRAREDADRVLKMSADLAKAKTDVERKAVADRFEVATGDLTARRNAEDADTIRKRARAEDDRRFRQAQAIALQSFNDGIDNENLTKQIARIGVERDARITGINDALVEKQAQIAADAKLELEKIGASADERIAALKAKFFDKVGPLTDGARASIDTYIQGVQGRIGALHAAAVAAAAAVASVGGGGGDNGVTSVLADALNIVAAGVVQTIDDSGNDIARGRQRMGGAVYAAGGRSVPGGMSLVGERGPELVRLPGGADVFNTSETGRMLGGGSDDGRPVIIQLDGQVIARTTWSYLKRQNLVGSNLGFA